MCVCVCVCVCACACVCVCINVGFDRESSAENVLGLLPPFPFNSSVELAPVFISEVRFYSLLHYLS